MKYSLRTYLGAILFDLPKYIYLLNRKQIGRNYSWLYICNRDQKVTANESGVGVKCQWRWTSNLYLPKIFPHFGNAVFSKSLLHYQFNLTQDKNTKQQAAQVSFVIGHKGMNRSDLLLTTIDSIAAQEDCIVECIVVEQDVTPLIRDILPKWVTYVFSPTHNNETKYSRSRAFNLGAKHTSSECLIFHDNDLVVPTNYASETYKYYQQGFEFINLKRFIFYLTKTASNELIRGREVSANFELDSIMQNAEGGGSIGASKQAYTDIGEFDERFIGWGGEDNEFWERATTKNCWEFGYLPLIHLWHEAQPGKANYQTSDTKELYHKLAEEDPEKRITELKKRQALTAPVVTDSVL